MQAFLARTLENHYDDNKKTLDELYEVFVVGILCLAVLVLALIVHLAGG